MYTTSYVPIKRIFYTWDASWVVVLSRSTPNPTQSRIAASKEEPQEAHEGSLLSVCRGVGAIELAIESDVRGTIP